MIRNPQIIKAYAHRNYLNKACAYAYHALEALKHNDHDGHTSFLNKQKLYLKMARESLK